MTWLAEHLAFRRMEAARLRERTAELHQRAAQAAPLRDFLGCLRCGPGPRVIAEVKFASPSKGLLRPARDVEAVASAYHRAGAAALSVLVEPRGFMGDPTFLGRARSACPLPLLAKGFFLDPADLLQMRIHGADAALLIARALERQELSRMLEAARDLGLATLTEVHDAADLRKVAGLPLDMVGVNHRDLETLVLDMDRSARLAPDLPSGPVKVAESGLARPADLDRMAALGFDAVLVGSAFMAASDPGAALREVALGAR